MRENKREIVKKEYVTEYIAFDGEIFLDAEECKKYEASARAVVKQMAMEHRIFESSRFSIFEMGCEDEDVEVFYIRDEQAFQTVGRYILFECGTGATLPKADDFIGKEMILIWGYDHDFCEWWTLEEYLDCVRKNYERLKARALEERGV